MAAAPDEGQSAKANQANCATQPSQRCQSDELLSETTNCAALKIFLVSIEVVVKQPPPQVIASLASTSHGKHHFKHSSAL